MAPIEVVCSVNNFSLTTISAAIIRSCAIISVTQLRTMIKIERIILANQFTADAMSVKQFHVSGGKQSFGFLILEVIAMLDFGIRLGVVY